MFIVLEAIGNNVSVLNNEETGFALTFSSEQIARAFAEETCDFNYLVKQLL